MKSVVAGLVACALAAPVCANAAEPTVAQAAPAPASLSVALAPSQQASVLRAGTDLPLVTREELTTEKKKLRVGHRIQMEVAADVIQGGVVVVPAGTPAVGEVTEVRNKGMWGKSGYINARVISVRVGDRVFRASGAFDDKGVAGGVGAVAVSAIIIPVAGFFMTGTSAKIPSGTPVKGYLDEDIAFQAPAAQPVVASVAAPTAVAAASN